MAFTVENRSNTFNGILFVGLVSIVATYVSEFNYFKELAISPLIIGIVLGIVYGNSSRMNFADEWQSGIVFSTKTLLRAGIVFYGFRLTFQDVSEVGVVAILFSLIIVSSTFFFGCFTGTKVLKLDRDTSILISAGSSICGAAAVLATEPVLDAEPYKTSLAVATVVVFGTVTMFLYPFVYQSGFLDFSEQAMGVYLGGTLHEVAHVVGAGYAINEDVANTAVIVKMLRVMLLAPFLLILGFWLKSQVAANQHSSMKGNTNITVPWFALGFIAMVAFNSLHLLSSNIVNNINYIDTFLLTMAMTALGMETRLEKFKGMGFKPVYLAIILFAWLTLFGYLLTVFLFTL
jgi:uncharacterized integral membrane protein (TIGR00698 family)